MSMFTRWFKSATSEWVNASELAPLPIQVPLAPVGAHSDGLAISAAQTLAPPAGASRLLIQALGQNVRYTLDGTTPTASAGFQLRAGDPPVLIPIGSGTVVKVIEEAATADLQYQWGR
ncbi:MAG: hypothetical protein ACK47B_22475 [Armatimonadota bacterium]